MPTPLVRFRGLPALVIGLALSVLALAIWWSGLQLRQQTREQLANRDGEILDAVALLQQFSDDAGDDSPASLDDPGEQFNLIMRISRLKGVLGIRLFRPDGAFFNAFPAYISEGELSPAELARLQSLKPVSHFLPRASLQDVDLLAQGSLAPVPLLVVNVPLHPKNQPRLAGVAQFIIQGQSLAREFAELDHHLFFEGTVAFLAGGVVLGIALFLAFRRIQRANRLLAQRTGHLLRANQELAMAAKTSALGAVTAHLIHGLKNPLTGLQSFLSTGLEGHSGQTGDTDWEEAAATTRRMQALIGQVVRVLEEQRALGDYEISLGEMAGFISARILPVARSAGVEFVIELSAEATLSNRDANLTILILENLLQNAIQATPSGKSVRLSLGQADREVCLEVRDQGPGFPLELQDQLFSPCRSTKQGGGGIGLAISKQLANHLGATLELRANSPQGCIFSLLLPAKMLGEPRHDTARLVSG